MLPDYLKDFTGPTSIITISVVVGGIVAALKSRATGNLLDAIPVAWIKRIPSQYLPWIAVFLGVAILTLDAKLNGDLRNWNEALAVGISGVLAGGTAIGGNETIAKLLKFGLAVLKSKKDAEPPASPPVPITLRSGKPPSDPPTA